MLVWNFGVVSLVGLLRLGLFGGVSWWELPLRLYLTWFRCLRDVRFSRIFLCPCLWILVLRRRLGPYFVRFAVVVVSYVRPWPWRFGCILFLGRGMLGLGSPPTKSFYYYFHLLSELSLFFVCIILMYWLNFRWVSFLERKVLRSRFLWRLLLSDWWQRV